MERSEKGGLTPKSFLIGVILVIGMTILLHLLGGFTIYFPEATTNSLVFAILVIFLLSLFASKIGLTPQEHTVIYAMLLVSTAFAATWTFTIFGQSIIAVGHPLYGERSSQLMNPIFGPKDPDLVQGAFAGGAEVPWEAWLIPMFYWIMLSLAMCISGLFLSCIMRKQYVEVETLPFPMATPVLTLTEERSFLRLPNVKWILWGMLIGLVWIPLLFFFLNELYPPLALPRLGYYQNTGMIDVAPYLWSILPMAVLAFGWSNISILAFGLLVPTDILLTAVVLHGVFLWIIPAVEVQMNLLYANPEYSVAGQWLYRLADSGFKGAIHHNEILRFGGLIGLGILPLIYERRHIVRTLKAVIHPKPDEEASEPLTYRWSWIGFIATTVLAVLLMLVGGMPLWAIVLFLLLYNVLILGITRLRGESGGWAGNAEEMRAPISATLYQAGFASNPATSAHWSSLMISGTYTWWGFLTAMPPPVTSSEAFRVASATKTRSRDLFVAISVAIMIAMLIGFPFALWGIYRYGITGKWLYSRIDGAFMGDMGFWQNVNYLFYTGGAPVSWNYPPDWIQVGVGVALVGFFMFMRARYVWFPFNPIGIPLAGFVLSPGYIFLWLVAYIIKYAVLKIGGTKLYEEKLVPLAVGIILMSTILMFISGIVTILRVA